MADELLDAAYEAISQIAENESNYWQEQTVQHHLVSVVTRIAAYQSGDRLEPHLAIALTSMAKAIWCYDHAP